MKSLDLLKKELLRDNEIRKQYDDLGPEFAVVELLITQRLKRGLSQAQLAKKIGTKQSAISRFESGNSNPTIGFIGKIASALGTKVRIAVS